MKKLALLLAAGVFSLTSVQSWAADKVALQLKWVTQAQFAGYYVAKDKGFYKAEDLDVEIKPGGPDIAPAQVLAGGGADTGADTGADIGCGTGGGTHGSPGYHRYGG